MFKKIQLLSLCVCALAASQVNAANNKAEIAASLTIDSELSFLETNGDLKLKPTGEIETVTLHLTGNSKAILKINSSNEGLKHDISGDSVGYNLNVQIGSNTAAPITLAGSSTTAVTAGTIDAFVNAPDIIVTANVPLDEAKKAKPGTHKDVITLTLEATA